MVEEMATVGFSGYLSLKFPCHKKPVLYDRKAGHMLQTAYNVIFLSEKSLLNLFLVEKSNGSDID